MGDIREKPNRKDVRKPEKSKLTDEDEKNQSNPKLFITINNRKYREHEPFQDRRKTHSHTHTENKHKCVVY